MQVATSFIELILLVGVAHITRQDMVTWLTRLS